MKRILCLSNEPWSAYPGRTQQLVSRLKDARVLFFSPPSGLHDRSYRERGRQVRPNVITYTLPPIFDVEERYSVLFRAGQRRLAGAISARSSNRRSLPLLWVTNPSHVHLLDQLDYSGLIYDCDREWNGLSPQWEGGLAMAADVVFAASRQLSDRLAPCSSNIALLPNGVNYSLFSDPDFAFQKHTSHSPVIGLCGPVHPDLDLSPLLYLAREQPDWTVLLIANFIKGNSLLSALTQLSNVHVHRIDSLNQLPGLLYRCDILVELLRRSQTDSSLISSCMYEYLATGRPVVSMLWPEQVEPFPDVVYAAHSPAEFLTCCRHALDEVPDFVSQRRRDHAAAANWSVRAEEVSRILSSAGLL